LKILEKDLKEGRLTLKVESLNDLWTLYNVISKNDHVTTVTRRRVILKEGTSGERKTMRLTLDVEELAFHEFSNRLRIKGKIFEGPDDYVSHGSYHTFNIEINNIVEIKKTRWLSHELDLIKNSYQFEENFIILIIAIETGLATIALITNFSYNHVATVKKNIPGKRYHQSDRNKSYKEFFEAIKKILEENLKNTTINLLVICGPGSVRIHLEQYLKEHGNFSHLAPLENLNATSGTKSGILEVLKSPKLKRLKKKVKIFQDSEKIEKILALFNKDPDLIAIGTNEVLSASEKGAIEEVLLVDELLRGISKKNKKIIEVILTNVKKHGGKINIMSSNNAPGQRLKDLGSLVGILRYKP